MIEDSAQKVKIGTILKSAFQYWSRSMMYQIMFSLVYFSVLLMVVFYFSEKLGLLEQYKDLYLKYSNDLVLYQQQAQKLALTPEYMRFFWILTGTLVFLFPLNMGLFKIYRKMDLQEKTELSDLFAGYAGANFFRYLSLAFFWIMVYQLVLQTLILPFLWILITLFTAPLMFFTNKQIFETIPLNIKGLKIYGVEIVVCVLIGIFFKYMGVISILGAVFTFPFMTAIIYALYKVVFQEVNR